ncbi:hypothetical protein ACSBLW_01025 [Thioclava sp. FR2]|uniref:hypothetical protein n=1 Tax=Thioclava sp. FR2 TaxID=3445780 RepID=UPI003EBAB316
MEVGSERPRLSLYCETNDRLVPILVDDLEICRASEVYMASEQVGMDVGVSLFASQTAFLSRVFAGQVKGRFEIVLRRCSKTGTPVEWEQGLMLLSAVLDRMPPEHYVLHALTPDSAAEFAGHLKHPVRALTASAERRADDPRKAVTVDEARGSLYWNGAGVDLDAWNWSRLRRAVRFDLSSAMSDDLRDICEYCNEHPNPSHRPAQATYLIVVPNGVGLGHLTRMMAIADELMAEKGAGRIEFWSFSQAAGVIDRAGYPVHLRHSVKLLGCNVDDWHFWEKADLVQTLRRLKPRAVLVDGSELDLSVIEAIRDPLCGAPDLVWVRRGMWNKRSSRVTLGGAQYATSVLVPGDLAEAVDDGPTVDVDPLTQGLSTTWKTAPVILSLGNEPMARTDAKSALKISRFKFRKTCLVSLGGDAFDLLGRLTEDIRDAAHEARVDLIWAQSPLAPVPDILAGLPNVRKIYPLGRFLNAFDGAISATGYNSFHELLCLTEFPVLFVPMVDQRLDSQSNRAIYAAAQGWSDVLISQNRAEIRPSLARFFEKVRRGERMASRPRPENGAIEMAQRIAELGGRG